MHGAPDQEIWFPAGIRERMSSFASRNNTLVRIARTDKAGFVMSVRALWDRDQCGFTNCISRLTFIPESVECSSRA